MGEKTNMDHATRVSFLKETRLFGDIPVEYLSVLAEMSEIINMEPDTVILKEGDTNDSLYLLLEGVLAVNLAGKPIIMLRRSGDIVGEMSLINKKPCTATVAAYSSSMPLSFQPKMIPSKSVSTT